MFILVLNFIAIIATALFGLYGSINNVKGENGEYTAKGKFIITGILVSALLTASIQVYSDVVNERNSEKLIETNDQILYDVRRSQMPLDFLNIEYSIKSNLNHPKLLSVINDTKNSRVEDLKEGFENDTYMSVVALNKNNNPFLFDLYSGVGLYINFYKNQVDLDNIEYVSFSDNSNIDLKLLVDNPYYNEFQNNNVIFTSVKNDLVINSYLKIMDIKLETTSKDWRSNGNIVSLQDLLGGQMIIQVVEHSKYSRESMIQKEIISELRKNLVLNDLLLITPNGLKLHFHEENLQKHLIEDDLVFYSFDFPTNLEELYELTFYNDSYFSPWD